MATFRQLPLGEIGSPPLFYFFACFVVSTLSFAISASALETVGFATSWLTLFCLPFFATNISPFLYE